LLSVGQRTVAQVIVVPSISTVARNGSYGYSGDGSAATSAELSNPIGVAVDSADHHAQGLDVNFTYNGSSTAPTAAGSYPVVATISDSNYTGTGNRNAGHRQPSSSASCWQRASHRPRW
jgi:hypothetical protein